MRELRETDKNHRNALGHLCLYSGPWLLLVKASWYQSTRIPSKQNRGEPSFAQDACWAQGAQGVEFFQSGDSFVSGLFGLFGGENIW